MTEFDPELYLRMVGERELASGMELQHAAANGWGQLEPAAAALVTTGTIDADLAAAITADYATADILRARDLRRLAFLRHRHSNSQPTPSVPLTPRRVFALGTVIPREDGSRLLVHSLTFAGTAAWLQCEIYSEAPFRNGVNAGSPGLWIRNAGGRRVDLHLGSGGWSEHRAKGQFEIPEGTLAPDAAWIDVEGTRIELAAQVPPPPVEVEHFDRSGLPFRYLWQLLADPGPHHRGPNVSAAIDALLAAGLIAAEDAEVLAIEWVRQARGDRHIGFQRRHGFTVSPPSGPIPAQVPLAWRSLLSPGRPAVGAHGSIAVAATTPFLDGVSVAVNVLRAHAEEGLSLEVETSGPRAPFELALAWWANDDRGHHYLGQINGWSASATSGKGTIEFEPLDPKATELTLAITSLNARALIHVPLDWQT